MTHPEMTDATQLLNRFVHAVTAYELEDIPHPVDATAYLAHADTLQTEAYAEMCAPDVQPVIAPSLSDAQPVAQWQKRHIDEEDGKWQNTNEGDAKWWRDNSQGWKIRSLYAAPQPVIAPAANIREALEALVSNNEHAESGGIARHQKGSPTWQLWRDAEQALGITGDKQ